ncbi:MAG: hypothetical protein Fur0014_11100 [Rubrivivax sp.]
MTPDGVRLELQAALAECGLHAEVLSQALSLDPLPDDVPFVQKLQRLERLGAVVSRAGPDNAAP